MKKTSELWLGLKAMSLKTRLALAAIPLVGSTAVWGIHAIKTLYFAKVYKRGTIGYLGLLAFMLITQPIFAILYAVLGRNELASIAAFYVIGFFSVLWEKLYLDKYIRQYDEEQASAEPLKK